MSRGRSAVKPVSHCAEVITWLRKGSHVPPRSKCASPFETGSIQFVDFAGRCSLLPGLTIRSRRCATMYTPPFTLLLAQCMHVSPDACILPVCAEQLDTSALRRPDRHGRCHPCLPNEQVVQTSSVSSAARHKDKQRCSVLRLRRS